MQLSRHFSLAEMLRSQTAERDPALRRLQQSRPPKAIESLQYLAATTLEPLREAVGGPIYVNSGYRSRQLNKRIGGSPRSQHLLGEAADIEIFACPSGFVLNTAAAWAPGVVDLLDFDLSLNGWLGIYIATHLESLDVDQVIFEYGPSPLRPAWIHVAASRRQSRRRITFVGEYTGRRYLHASLDEALERWVVGGGSA